MQIFQVFEIAFSSFEPDKGMIKEKESVWKKTPFNFLELIIFNKSMTTTTLLPRSHIVTG